MAGSKDVVLVCEDSAHYAFVYSCLSRLGIDNLQWHIVPYVASAKRQLHGNRDEVVTQVKNVEFDAWESRCANHKVLLVAVLDADMDSVTGARALLPTSQHYGKLFAVVIPKRNIQTWVELAINCTSTTLPNETDDYKRTATRRDKKAKEAANRLLDWWLCVASLPPVVASNPVWTTLSKQMADLQQAIRVWK